MRIPYKGETFTESDVAEIKQLLAEEKRGQGLSYSTTDEKAFYIKFEKIGGFTRCVNVEKDDAYVIVNRGWDLNHAVINDIIHQYENPLLEDKWAKWTLWFKSRSWTLPLFVLFVGVPCLAQYVDWIIKIVNYLIGNTEPPDAG